MTLTLGGAPARSSSRLVPVRSRDVAGRTLLTNPWGDWIALTREDAARVRDGAIDGDLERRLAARHFLREGLDVEALVDRSRRKTRFLAHGPNLHILVVTLRCNETCVYCHASRRPMDQEGADMSAATAERAVEMALRSTSPGITIEFQGGEPLANFAVLRHAIEHALAKNRAIGKRLDFTLVSNLALMDEEKLAYLVERRVQICTSLDGPPDLHDKQRRLAGGSAHAKAVEWIARINARYAAMGLDPAVYHVEALLTTTRDALARPHEIVDAYVGVGCRALFLRPVDPFGFAARSGDRVRTTQDAFLAFYREAVEHMLELNRRGVQILERYAGIFLTKILTPDDPNFLDIRSPCGAGIGQLAYDHDGRVYTCDEGRMLAASGDSMFELGALGETTYRQIVRHPTVGAMLAASNLDGQSGCVNCAYKPYCGVCPVFNYASQGSLHGRMGDSAWCRVHMGIQDFLFEKLIEADPATLAIFDRWITVRARTHYVHDARTS